MQYFVRTMEKHKESSGAFSSELLCYGLAAAKAEAKRLVLSANPALQLQADACARNGEVVQTKYRCWINERGGSGRACSCKVRPRVAQRRTFVLALGWLLISRTSFEFSNSA